MKKKLWNHIKSLRLTKRMFHVSARVDMVKNPDGSNTLVGWTEKPGLTFVRWVHPRSKRRETNVPRTA